MRPFTQCAMQPGVRPSASRGSAIIRIIALGLVLSCVIPVSPMAIPSAIASEEDQKTKETGDPWERGNRVVYTVNDAGDRWVVKPLAKAYNRLPTPIRRGLHNMFENLGEPRTAINQFLQGKPRKGMEDTTRFLINSTFGLLGWFDLATRNGLPRNEEDFGQTFGVWGIGSGPFVMLPGLGPSTVTDTVGTALDIVTNPIEIIESDWQIYAIRGADAIDTRAELLSVEEVVSGDRYLFLRDAYLQRRTFMINDGVIEAEDDPFLDDFDDYDDESLDDY